LPCVPSREAVPNHRPPRRSCRRATLAPMVATFATGSDTRAVCHCCRRRQCVSGTPAPSKAVGSGRLIVAAATGGEGDTAGGKGAGSDGAEPREALGGESIPEGMPASVYETLTAIDSTALPQDVCLLETRESVKDFAEMQLQEIEANITARQTKIFLLLEESRRLRIQQKVKGGKGKSSDEVKKETFNSALPFFPEISEETLDLYRAIYGAFVMSVLAFGGLVAPVLEVKLGLGGQSYRDFIEMLHLPAQLSEVDPIVASFCGGAIGVVTTLLLVETNNVKNRAQERCPYCRGTGYLACGICGGSGLGKDGCACTGCSSVGRVMCTNCFATGKKMTTEHDIRLDPYGPF